MKNYTLKLIIGGTILLCILLIIFSKALIIFGNGEKLFGEIDGGTTPFY
jgi:hypothetical protein